MMNFRQQHITSLTRLASVAVLLLFAGAFLTRCASIGNPTGGPRDSLAPTVVTVTPMLNATNFCEKDSHFILLYHTPKPLLRSIYEEHYAKHPEHLRHNICHRFRHASQYNAEELQYMTLYQAKRCVMRSAESELLYMKAKDDTEYVRRKLEGFSKHPAKKFGCFNSLDLATPEARDEAIEWIERRIGIK